MFERILVALKFGPASMHALNKSLEIARLNNAELQIFHALDYLLQDLDDNDPRLLEVKHKTEHRFKSEIEPLLGNLKNISKRKRIATMLYVCLIWGTNTKARKFLTLLLLKILKLQI